MTSVLCRSTRPEAPIPQLHDLIPRRRRSAGQDETITDGRIAQWEAFSEEAERHMARLGADDRDGGLHQVSARPDLYLLPLDSNHP